MNMGELSEYARDLTGVKYSDVVSDNLILRFLNEALAEISLQASWPWSERQDYLDLPADTHLVQTEAGVQRIQEVVVRSQDGRTQVSARPVTSTLALEERSVSLSAGSRLYYDNQAGSIDIYPSLREDATVEVRYQVRPVNLGPDDEAPFPESYHPMLAYRAAYKILLIQADDTNRYDGYNTTYERYLDLLGNEFLTDATEGPFQLAEDQNPNLKRRL